MSGSDIQKYNNNPESNSIVVFKQEELSHISKELRPYIEAKNSPVLSQMTENASKNRLKDLILTLFLVSGQTLGDDDKNIAAIGIMRDILLSDIKKKWPIATLEEISSALNSGARGEFEQQTGKLFGGITIMNCNIWIDCYFKSTKRSQAFIMLSVPKPLEVEPITEEDKEKKRLTIENGIKGLKKNYVEPIKEVEKEKRIKRLKEIKESSINTTYDRDQIWLMQFDQYHERRRLFTDQATQRGLRLIYRYGELLSITDFMKRKIQQVEYIKIYLEERASRTKQQQSNQK